MTVVPGPHRSPFYAAPDAITGSGTASGRRHTKGEGHG
jgi:hypothetical protein